MAHPCEEFVCPTKPTPSVSDDPPLPGDEGVLKENLDVKDYEDWKERAAILECDGGLERNEAEQRARRTVFDK